MLLYLPSLKTLEALVATLFDVCLVFAIVILLSLDFLKTHHIVENVSSPSIYSIHEERGSVKYEFR